MNLHPDGPLPGGGGSGGGGGPPPIFRKRGSVGGGGGGGGGPLTASLEGDTSLQSEARIQARTTSTSSRIHWQLPAASSAKAFSNPADTPVLFK